MTPNQRFLVFICMIAVLAVYLGVMYFNPLFEEARQRKITGEEKCDAFCLKINMTPQEKSYGGFIGDTACFCERTVMCADNFCNVEYKRFDITERRGDV